MAKKKTGQKLEQEGSFESGEQPLNEDKTQDKADAKLLRESINTLQALAEGKVDPDLVDPGYDQVHHEAAEDADDELDSGEDNEYKELRPLMVKKTKTDSDQVHLSTNHPEQNTQITAHTHGFVKRTNNIAQAGKGSAEFGLTARIASKHNLPRTPTPSPKLSPANRGSDLLHSPSPLRRRKGSKNLRQDLSDSASVHSIMSSYTYLTPNQRGKMLQGGSNEHATSGSEDQAPKPNLKARTVLGFVENDESNAEKSPTNLLPSPKAAHEKKTFRKLFRRKGDKEPTTPSSSSGKASGRRVISAPTLIDASPNAKNLLDSAPLLIDDPPTAKHVVNYSRPIARHTSSDASSGSPVRLRGPTTTLHGSIPFTGPGPVPEGLINTSLIHDHSDPSVIDENKAADAHHVVGETLSTEKNADASDSDSFNPSDYSGDENSVQQAMAVPIIFSGNAELVNIRPHHGTSTAAPSNQSAIGNTLTSSTTQLTDHDAEVLGAQDAARYYYNGMKPQTRSGEVNTADPFIDPPFRPLLSKPANSIAALEMLRIQAERAGEGAMAHEIRAEVGRALSKEAQIHGITHTASRRQAS